MITRTSIPAKTGNANLQMRTTAFRLCVLLLWASCLVTIYTEWVVAQGRGYMIWGDVNVNVSEADLPGPSRLNLLLYNQAGRLVGRQTVTPHGRYRFTSLSAGEYDLVIEIENVEVTRIHFNANGSPGSDFRQDLQFEWRRKPSHEKSTPGTISAADAYSRSSVNQALFQKAEEATDKKKYELAASILKQIVENDNLDFQAWTLLGTISEVQQKPANAESAYLSALTANPTFALALIDLGRLRSDEKRFAEAIEPLTRSVEIQPQSGGANLLLKQGSKAVPYLNEAAKNGRPEAHLRLGWLYNAAGMKDKAAAEYEGFLKKKPDYSDRKKLEEYIAANKKI
jgi:hypothetical protein